MCSMKLFVGLLVLALHTALCQENAATSLALSLTECYNNTLFTTRDYRLPATIQTLIEIIRKIEDGSSSANAHQLAIQILHRFRQDGIWKNEKHVSESIGLPYSPRRMESHKYHVQLTILTPWVGAFSFNNESLNRLERCSLHSAISSTIETSERGDEDAVCSKIARYTNRLARRDVENVERVESATLSSQSQCPVESGVVHTKWGAVKAGLVLAGLAAGFQQQDVPSPNNKMVDNRYASTIAGELTEAALHQDTNVQRVVGARGGWNSTLVPRYYFLETNENLEITDAEIRGGLDGLYLALNVDAWKKQAPNIKVSQILDLYYSPRGVFDKAMRACNRNQLQTTMTTTAKLTEQVTNFNYLLDSKDSVLAYSPNRSYFTKFAENTVKSFNDYIAQLKDVECAAEPDIVERAAVDVLIFLDTSWTYLTVQPLLAYLIENIDVNKFGSNYLIYDGINTNEIVNTSNTILDYYETYNITEHQNHPHGFDYNKVFHVIENKFKAKLNNETETLRGQSTIALLIPHDTPNENQKQFASQRKDLFRTYLPDVRILVLGSGNREAYADLVFNANNDAFTLADNTDERELKSTAKAVVDRIKQIPRRVANPKCGSQFESASPNTFEVTQYVEPQGINYHRVAPNYFFAGDERRLKVRGLGQGSVMVCMSRTATNPRQNASDIECQQVAANEASFDLTDYCSDETVSTCRPIFISVEGIKSQISCEENLCRFPDSIKYQITLENVGCVSGSGRIIGSFLVIAIFAVLRF